MPISVTVLDENIQLTDGNWLREPFFDPTVPYIDVEDVIENVDLSGFDSEWTATLDLNVIGDFNGDEEVFILTVEEGEADETVSQLFDANPSNDDLFNGQNTGPTDGVTEINGVTNPLIGARWDVTPSQGNVAINGHQPNFNPSDPTFTTDDVEDIQNNEAVFTADTSVNLSADFSQYLGNSDVDFKFQIADANVAEVGVDFAQIATELTVTRDWVSDGGHAISNVVFYVECDDEIVKIKLDDWDELAEEYASTELLDINEDTVDALAIECGIASDADDCSFIGMTIKAGNNRETEIDGQTLKPNQTGGEGEIIFGSIEGDYGKQLKPECTVQATDWIVDDGFLV